MQNTVIINDVYAYYLNYSMPGRLDHTGNTSCFEIFL